MLISGVWLKGHFVCFELEIRFGEEKWFFNLHYSTPILTFFSSRICEIYLAYLTHILTHLRHSKFYVGLPSH